MTSRTRFTLLICIFFTLALLSCEKSPAGGAGVENGSSLMVMSFNVRSMSMTEQKEQDQWENRRDACCAMINYHRPVMMGVQECARSQRDYIKRKCRGYDVLGISKDSDEDGEQTCIFYLEDSITVLKSGTFWLTDTPDRLSKLDGHYHYRTATWIKALHKSTNKEFYHINTHLDNCGNDFRSVELEIILDFVKKNCADYPVVMMGKPLLLVLSAVFAVSCIFADNSEWTDRPYAGKPLAHWTFSKDRMNWDDVTVPHSYNNIDGQSKSYYRGEAYYRTSLPACSGKGARYLVFEGVGQSAHVIADGDTLCYHSGAYTPFYVDITGKNYKQIEVSCENTQNLDRIPLTSDFNKNGGIHYPAWVLDCPDVHFTPRKHGFYRLHVSPLSVTDDLAKAQARTMVRNVSARPKKTVVEWALLDAEGKTVLSHKEKVAVPAGSEKELVWDFSLTDPHLWNGLADPYLYTVAVTAGKDRAETEVGFRYFRVDPKEGFFLNGRSYPLRGVAMHQDLAGKATAMDRADIDRDMEIVREIGCNFLRLAHYPHNDYTFRLCDRMGIVVQTEIPWVNNCGTEMSEAYVQNIYDQMTEMVTSLYNHPSIIFWGMWNELDKWGHTRYNVQGLLDERRVADETARLYDFTKALDPYRLVGLTDDSVYENDHYSELKADFYSENRYHGWYYNYGKFDRMSAAMKKINEKMGVTNLSEYGPGVNPYCHTWKDEDIRRDATDSLHFEEYGNRFHESHAAQIAESPYLNFTSLWVLFDFPVAEREEGIVDSDNGVDFVVNPERKYLNDKGIVTRDRKVFKDVFYLYKSWWNKDVETVYITARRLKYRPADQEFVMTVYSNAPSLKIFCNGTQVAEASETEEPTGVVWKFNVKMGTGPTVFKAVSPNGTSDEIEILPLQD